ncbi:MAG: hypothetical protein ACKVT2_00970 [Saprospiraceae bacterium]
MKKAENTESSNLKGLEMDYSTLRGEISKRIELRQQINSFSLTLTGIFLGVSLSNDSVGTVAFAYPPLAAMLALGWMQNDLRIGELGYYIRKHIEPHIPGLNWETFLNKKRQGPQKDNFRFLVLSHGGIFLITQLLAIGAGLFNFKKSPVEWTFLSIDILSIIVVLWVISKIWKR